ncbi:2Fe-2S iron-sulfur cluster binding domain-containing protein [Thalassomonas viridans]|uniref:2Fe-2S iron-sulfur cluster binding domain-containing protein n=1 Tax=Thalassomonas viridans TaxID=137584 RepID=A0AAE9YYR1_9GAMM|nr:class I ribonucleotide reductase maintenance protein YfaE [Thalassomonas viridans]WDE03022.1 2Fe-2S iron-sulfur cluster binding domain-containing protein [Thalassomonas viridans]
MSKAQAPCQGDTTAQNHAGQAADDTPKDPVIRVEEKDIPCPRRYSSILECLEDADVEVDYHCRDGFCGACRVTLCQGQVAYPQGEPLAFVGEGEILTCCSLPVTDITLELN